MRKPIEEKTIEMINLVGIQAAQKNDFSHTTAYTILLGAAALPEAPNNTPQPR